MWHVGIDLHRQTVVIGAVDDLGNASDPRRIDCQDRAAILDAMTSLQPFRAVLKQQARTAGSTICWPRSGPCC